MARLLADLGGGGLRRGEGATALAAPCPTGLAEVDRLLGGGFPRGRLSEITGPPSSGRTSLALALLTATTREGHLAAVLDGADAFDPASADAAGVVLERVLWARPPGLREALRGAEHVLSAGGFALVLVDLTHADAPPAATAAWVRLRRLAAGRGAALVVLGRRRLADGLSDLALELDAAGAHFSPPARGQPWLQGLEASVRLVRHRSGPAGRAAAVHWHAAA